MTNLNYRGKYGTVGSYYYVLNFAKSDTSGSGGFASTPGHLGYDYGRAVFDTRNRIFLFGNIPLPHLISVSPFLIANSGTPYNITSGLNVNDDNIINNRAVLVAPGTPVTTGQVEKQIAGCGNFATPGTGGVFTQAADQRVHRPGELYAQPASFQDLRASGASRVADANAARTWRRWRTASSGRPWWARRRRTWRRLVEVVDSAGAARAVAKSTT